MLSKSEIEDMAKATIEEMVSQTPELSELSESAKGAMQGFFALGYVSGHEDATKEYVEALNK